MNEDGKIKKNIAREVQLMKSCKSPYIVSFFGVDYRDGDVIVLMEYLDRFNIQKYRLRRSRCCRINHNQCAEGTRLSKRVVHRCGILYDEY